jgi:hypothetical protein
MGKATDGHGKNGSVLSRVLMMVVLLCLTLIGVYLIKAGVLYSQYTSAYAKWGSHKIDAYSISVISNKTGFDSGFAQSQTVQGERVVQGYNAFDKPVIEWAFAQAQFCASAWPLCDWLHWSFQYEPTWGYPTHIEYDEDDGHYFLTLKDLTVSGNTPGHGNS